MIFVTVGTQLPFDRLVQAVDEIAPLINEEIIVQANKGSYIPQKMECKRYLCADEFDDVFKRARLIISHAGTGTIISALVQRKPIIIMPRFAFLGEHRNEHQYATAMKVNELGYVYVAYDKQQLQSMILNSDIQCLQTLGNNASDNLISSLSNFIKNKY